MITYCDHDLCKNFKKRCGKCSHRFRCYTDINGRFKYRFDFELNVMGRKRDIKPLVIIPKKIKGPPRDTPKKQEKIEEK
jgi:hypothetical protein